MVKASERLGEAGQNPTVGEVEERRTWSFGVSCERSRGGTDHSLIVPRGMCTAVSLVERVKLFSDHAGCGAPGAPRRVAVKVERVGNLQLRLMIQWGLIHTFTVVKPLPPRKVSIS